MARKTKRIYQNPPSRTYNSWRCMRQRCNNKNSDRYKDYGAKGITVCKEWDKFKNFLADMGVRPENKTLDRIDNSAGYCPNNCKWSTGEEQNYNRKGMPSRLGEKHIVRIGKKYRVLINRLNIYGLKNTLVEAILFRDKQLKMRGKNGN